jgi:hypothetical protein
MQGEEVLTSRPPRRKGGFTVPGQPLAGGCAQYPGKPDGAVAPSFYFSRPVSGCLGGRWTV